MSGWFKKKIAERRERRKDEIVLYSYPKLLFIWPLIFMGYFLWLADHGHWASPQTLAWIYLVTMIVVGLTMGIDIGRNMAIFWVVMIAGCWILVLWLRDVKQVKIFGYIHEFFRDLAPTYSRSLGLIVSIVFTVAYLIMVLWSRLNDKWRITHNLIEHIQFGRKDLSIARAAKSIRSSYPDAFETALFLAGEIMISDPSGRNVLYRISNVPLLPFVQKRIDLILETTAVTPEILEEEGGAMTSGEAEEGTP